MPAMNEYYDFLHDRSGMLPCTNRGIHKMKTDALPIKKNRYKVPFALKEAMGRQLDDILKKGAITPACSEWEAPRNFGEREIYDTPKYRFCTDFRGLNAVTKIPVYPIPDIKCSLSLMAGSRYFTLVDTESAYWRIHFHPDDDKTGFITPFGCFRYERLSDGLAETLSTCKKNYGCNFYGTKRHKCSSIWMTFSFSRIRLSNMLEE
jgi:hypothetical protein